MCTDDTDNVLASVTSVYVGDNSTATSAATSCTGLFSFTVGLQDSAQNNYAGAVGRSCRWCSGETGTG